MWQGEGVHLVQHDPANMRSMPKQRDGRTLRTDAAGLQALLAQEVVQ